MTGIPFLCVMFWITLIICFAVAVYEISKEQSRDRPRPKSKPKDKR